MKNFLLWVLMAIAVPGLGQRLKNEFKLSLTPKERLAYVLGVDQNKISKPRETTVGGKKQWISVIVPVNLSNLSNDNLIYVNMTCSTYDIFTVNNNNINIEGWGCDKNVSTEYKIPPHKSSMFNFTVNLHKNNPSQKFRFGIYLIRPKTRHWGFDIMDSFWKSKESFKNCLIWSNEVTIPR